MFSNYLVRRIRLYDRPSVQNADGSTKFDEHENRLSKLLSIQLLMFLL